MRAEPIYQLRKVKDLKDMMVQSTNLFGSRNAFLIKGKNGEYYAKTYKELKNDIDALGTALIDMGLKDKKIAILSQNRAEWCTTYLTVTGGVGVVVPLDRELPYNEVENLTSRAGVDAIVFSSKHRSDMLKLSRTSDIKYFIDMDLDADDDNKFLSLPKLIEKGESLLANGDRRYLDAEIDENKMAALIFTSGTTDLAKGVM
ncbi:AMP-binding protein, partial [Ruminiclostridium cellobioparum]